MGGLFCRRPILTGLAPSPRRALRPDLPVVRMFGFWTQQVYIGFSLFVLAKGRSGQFVHDTLSDWRDGWLLGHSTSRRPVLPGPAAPRRPAVPRRLEPPVVCSGFGLDRFQVCHECDRLNAMARVFQWHWWNLKAERFRMFGELIAKHRDDALDVRPEFF